MKPITERVLDALRKFEGSLTFDELLMETVRACPIAPDASLPKLENAIDGLRERGLIELRGTRFWLSNAKAEKQVRKENS